MSKSIIIYYLHPMYRVKMYYTANGWWSSDINHAQHHWHHQFKHILNDIHGIPHDSVKIEFV